LLFIVIPTNKELARSLQSLDNMKIAIAYWQDRISPVFDVSDKLCLIDIENGNEVRRENKILKNRDPYKRAKEISEIGIDVLVCGAISRILEMALSCTGIRVTGFMCGNLDTVISAFLCGQLTDGRFFMPGCYGEQRRNRFCGGRISRRQK
jgi:predicted Fe-Mo cluster-binding NifX family protein